MWPYLEKVQYGARVQARLLVNGVYKGRLLSLLGKESGGQVKLQALGNLILKFKL